MHLTPREIEKLMLHNAGFVAQKRLARGTRLNYPESVALIAAVVLELIRDGKSVADCMELGQQMLGRNNVLPGVPEMIHEVQVEGTFPDGTKLVTVHTPIAKKHGDLELALYGSGLKPPKKSAFEDDDDETIPGELAAEDGHVELNAGRATVTLEVTNTGDRPVQVGSHYHFIETNKALSFDRAVSYGKRLDIPAGTAVRFEPGETRTVTLVDIAGETIIRGGNNLAPGPVNDDNRDAAMVNVATHDFGNTST